MGELGERADRAWLFVVGLTIDQTSVASWNNIILGVIVFLLAAGSFEAPPPLRRARRTTDPASTTKSSVP